MAQQPPVDQGLLKAEASRSHSDTPHSVELLRMGHQPDAEPPPDNVQHSQQTSMPPVGFEHTIPASERPQNHALDRAATSIDLYAY